MRLNNESNCFYSSALQTAGIQSTTAEELTISGFSEHPYKRQKA